MSNMVVQIPKGLRELPTQEEFMEYLRVDRRYGTDQCVAWSLSHIL